MFVEPQAATIPPATWGHYQQPATVVNYTDPPGLLFCASLSPGGRPAGNLLPLFGLTAGRAIGLIKPDSLR